MSDAYPPHQTRRHNQLLTPASEVELPLHFFVVNPEHVHGDHIQTATLHPKQLLPPL
jgi:hypothetical protein